MRIDRLLARITAFFLAGGVFVALMWPVILVFIVMHFLVKYW